MRGASPARQSTRRAADPLGVSTTTTIDAVNALISSIRLPHTTLLTRLQQGRLCQGTGTYRSRSIGVFPFRAHRLLRIVGTSSRLRGDSQRGDGDDDVGAVASPHTVPHGAGNTPFGGSGIVGHRESAAGPDRRAAPSTVHRAAGPVPGAVCGGRCHSEQYPCGAVDAAGTVAGGDGLSGGLRARRRADRHLCGAGVARRRLSIAGGASGSRQHVSGIASARAGAVAIGGASAGVLHCRIFSDGVAGVGTGHRRARGRAPAQAVRDELVGAVPVAGAAVLGALSDAVAIRGRVFRERERGAGAGRADGLGRRAARRRLTRRRGDARGNGAGHPHRQAHRPTAHRGLHLWHRADGGGGRRSAPPLECRAVRCHSVSGGGSGGYQRRRRCLRRRLSGHARSSGARGAPSRTSRRLCFAG
eukprot:ctg_9.g2